MAKTYDTYKDSGIAWIGEIPGEWEVCRLKAIYEVSDGTHDTPNYVDKSDNTFPLITSRCIEDGKINYILANHISKEDYEEIAKRSYVSKYDIIMPMIGTVGNPAVVMTDDKIAIKNVALFRCNGDYYKAKYLFFYLNSPLTLNQFAMNNKGGVQNFVSQDTIKRLLFIYPKDVHSIVSFLDEKCGEIDSLISIQEEMISELLAYKQAVITEAVTKGLDKKAKMKNSGVEWIGDIPEKWEVRRIKFIGDSKNGLTYTPSDVVSEHEGVLVLRSSNIQNGKLCYDDNVYVSSNIPSRLMVKKGDLIICSRNGSAALVGKCALVEEDITASFGAFMMRFQSQYNHKYIYYLLSCAITQYKQLFSTTTINQLTVGVFGSLIMPFTINETEQQAIATYLDEKTSQIDSLIALKQSKIESLKEYKKSIIYEYVTGKKRV